LFNILSEKSFTASILWDKLGIGISGICAIHCLLVPVLIAILPLWEFTAIMHEWMHPVFIILILPTVYYASRRSHFDRIITGLLTGGLILLLIGWSVGHYWIGLLFETVFTVAGSFALIAGHWFNYRHHQTCNIDRHNHHPNTEEEMHKYHETS
jgi:hypothetical protein